MFRPERGMVAMNLMCSVFIAALGVVITGLAVEGRSVWFAVLALGLVLLGGWMTYRCLVMRIAFDADSLHIVGFVRSRRIPRSAVLLVEQYDLELPMIQWSMPGAADRWSILTPLILNSSPFVPRTMYLRRHRFLAQLRSWARDGGATDVRPGVWSKIMDALGRMIMAIVGSPRLRVVIAIASLAVSASAYWLGITTMLGLINSGDEATRGAIAPLGLALLAAEGAYWVLPLRRRHPRAWHVALAVVMAPLAVLTLVALFS